MKLTFNEFKNLAGWGRHTRIWVGSSEYIKTCEDWHYYEANRLRESFSKEEREKYRLAYLAIDYECSPVLREKIRVETEENLKIVREQLKNYDNIPKNSRKVCR